MSKRSTAIALIFGGALAWSAPSFAEAPKVPLGSNADGTVYVAPNVTPTETSATTEGATIGVQRPDGRSLYGGVDTSAAKPTYSLGASTGGDVSFSAGAQSDGKANAGVKAGVTIKY